MNGMQCYSSGFYKGCFGKAYIIRNCIEYMLRDIDQFGKSTMFFKLRSGYTQYHPAITEIIHAMAGKPIVLLIDRGVKGHTVTFFPAGHILAGLLDDAGCFMSHDQWWYPSAGAAIHAMHIAAADAGCFDPH